MRIPRKARRRRGVQRWRETCVDGVLHAAFAAAAGAEAAAQRCSHTLARDRTPPRGARLRRLRHR
jgi:hypothetical protein